MVLRKNKRHLDIWIFLLYYNPIIMCTDIAHAIMCSLDRFYNTNAKKCNKYFNAFPRLSA